MSADFITVLKCAPQIRLSKFIRADGTIEAYDRAKAFDMAHVAVADLDALGRLLRCFLSRRDLCVVRGAIADRNRKQGVRRLVHDEVETGYQATLKDADHRWIGLDVEGVIRPDDVPATDLLACARFAVALLPAEFHGIRAIVAASAGHGLKAGSRLRMWYWASRPVSGAELTYWMRRSPVDPCLFRPGQINYVAAPVFETGVDHLPVRVADLDGAPLVQVPAPDDLRPSTPPPQSPRNWGLHSQTSADRIIAKSLYKVSTAGLGDKHYQLRNAARTIGGLLDQTGISRAEASRALLDAVRRAGGSSIDENNASATIAWGLEVGSQAPLKLEERR